MGDIKKQRKKFSKPGHPWNKERILADKEILDEYGLRRKKEVWKADSILSNFARQAKELITGEDEIKKSQLLGRLNSLGLLNKNAAVEDVLSITLKDILERRLQTLVVRKNLARSMNQSRQFIVHGHILIGDKKITIPSYLVGVNEENLIQFAQDSNLSSPEHSERVAEKKSTKKSHKKDPKEKGRKKAVQKEITKKPSKGKKQKKEPKQEEKKKEEVKEEK